LGKHPERMTAHGSSAAQYLSVIEKPDLIDFIDVL